MEAAFSKDGELLALKFNNIVNVGAFVRAPEPASVYRMHSASNGCYRVRDIAVENRLVVTNTTPIGLNRGYGGPQFYYALEQVMDAGAKALAIDPAEIRRRNFIQPEQFPYKAPAGAAYDSGNYEIGLKKALDLAAYDALKEARKEARADGKLFGIGMAAGIEPSGSTWHMLRLRKRLRNALKRVADPGGWARRPCRSILLVLLLSKQFRRLQDGSADRRRSGGSGCARATAGPDRCHNRGRHTHKRLVAGVWKLCQSVFGGRDKRYCKCSGKGGDQNQADCSRKLRGCSRRY